MPIFPLLAPINATPHVLARAALNGQLLVCSDDAARRALEMQPGKITRPTAHERLREGQKHDEQTRGDSIELRLDPRAQHVGKRHAQRAAKHQIRNDAQSGQKNSEAEKKNR